MHTSSDITSVIAEGLEQAVFGAALLAAAAGAPLLTRYVRRIGEGFHHYFGGLPMPATRKNEVLHRTACDEGSLIWIHGVSLGESLVGGTLISALRKRLPLTRIGYTTTHPDVLATMIKRGQTNAAGYFPLDFSPFWERSFRRWRPKLVLTVETDFWPGFSRACVRHDVPLVLVNGRISAKLHRFYSMFPALGRTVFGAYSLLLVQSPVDRERLIEMGAKPDSINIIGNIKIDIVPEINHSLIEFLMPWKGKDSLIVMGSMHQSEFEGMEPVIDTLLSCPHIRLLIAPRDIANIEKWEIALRRRGIHTLRRSNATFNRSGKPFTESVNSNVRCLLLDTIGELASLYQLADAAFIGGSLDESVGGHNPLEALSQNTFTVMGPHVRNFADLAEELSSAGGLELARNASAVGDILTKALSEFSVRQHQQQAAKCVLDRHRGALSRTMRVLEPYLADERMK
ncbi:MAG: hypothetical protein HQM09_16105 [Candidatus Riflebacteria bacterium]|nr:hypothetical protein [Candidatus Riflebacteria bacterium]